MFFITHPLEMLMPLSLLLSAPLFLQALDQAAHGHEAEAPGLGQGVLDGVLGLLDAGVDPGEAGTDGVGPGIFMVFVL